MNGAMADAPRKNMRAPNARMITMNGNSQNFFRCFRKPHMSFMKFMLLFLLLLCFEGITREDAGFSGVTYCLSSAYLTCSSWPLPIAATGRKSDHWLLHSGDHPGSSPTTYSRGRDPLVNQSIPEPAHSQRPRHLSPSGGQP